MKKWLVVVGVLAFTGALLIRHREKTEGSKVPLTPSFSQQIETASIVKPAPAREYGPESLKDQTQIEAYRRKMEQMRKQLADEHVVDELNRPNLPEARRNELFDRLDLVAKMQSRLIEIKLQELQRQLIQIEKSSTRETL